MPYPMTQQDTNSLQDNDPEIYAILKDELERQRNQIELIASENFTSLDVMQAQGSTLTNKYAEGYPGRRYYGGCEVVDQAEDLARNRAKEIFACSYANVQPHSGSQANQAVFTALLTPGDAILGMGMDAGGHLTHGSKVNLSGKWFHAFSYGVRKEDELIDMDEVHQLAKAHAPKLIIAGASAYSRIIDFKRFREIADDVGAYLLVDMAHFAGLVAGKQFPTPLPHGHVVTSTTHKTLRGPRGGLILTNDQDIYKKLNSAVFPGIQGGPLMHVIAAKAVAFGEILKDDFKTYAKQVIANCQAMARSIEEEGLRIVSGGTDCHLCSVDLTPLKITGHDAEHILEEAGITCNKNGIPFDPLPPMKTSGIRIGSPAGTTRGFQQADFTQIGKWIVEVLKAHSQDDAQRVISKVGEEVKSMCKKYPLYPELN